MKVREVMTAWPITVGPDHTLGEAVEEMLRRQVRSLPVVEDQRVVGMLTDRDVRVALGRDAIDLDLTTLEGKALEEPVRSWMTYGAATLGPEDPVAVACRALAAGRIGAMPVIDEDGEVIGIVSTTDLLTAAADLFDDLA